MKKRAISLCLAVLMLLLTLTGCGETSPSESLSEVSSSKIEESEQVTEQDEIITKTVNEDMTFDIKESWTPNDDGTPIYQFVEDGVVVAVGLNGVSPLSKGTPQEVFDDFVEFYETDATPGYKTVDYSKSVSKFTAKDGTECYYGSIIGEYYDMPYLCDVVIVPTKNKLISFIGQTASDGDEDKITPKLKFLRESLTFLRGAEDKITGGTFILDDGSEMALNSDLTFRFYRTQDDHSTDYYEGTYEVYRGEMAFEMLSSKTEYGLTREELDEMYDNHKAAYIYTPEDAPPLAEGTTYNICLDEFYVVVLHREKIVRADETREIGNDNVYFGYWLEEGGFAYLTNADQINSSKWIPKN